MPVLFVNAAWTFVKRILHRSSAKDGNRFVLAGCEGSPENRKECENDRDEPANPDHAVLLMRFSARMSARSDHQSFWQEKPTGSAVPDGEARLRRAKG